MFDLSTLDPKLLRRQYRHILALRQKAKTSESRTLLDGVLSILEALQAEMDSASRESLTLTLRKE